MRDYERLDKISENREEQKAYYIPYDSLEKALCGKKEESKFYCLLNGDWNFKYFQSRHIHQADTRIFSRTRYP